MMFKNPLLPILGELNAAFGGTSPTIGPGQRAHFAPGQKLGPALASSLNPEKDNLNQLLAAYIEMMPGGFQETLRSVIHYALGPDPQVLLNFSWAPSYDFELTMWEIVEPPEHNSAIHLLLKGRYPDHDVRFPAA